ncbi:MAG TPA: hypothetical protein DD435_03495 [Cyanobacteria bacterium UBA8530]|nr:hypothetical protein [Cyanobacteria bacterium UBA8530]
MITFNTHRIVLILSALSFTLSSTGCPLFGGVSAEDQDLIKNLREVKKYIAPSQSTNLNNFLRNWHYLTAFNLPSQYGIDLGNFYSLLPFGEGSENVATLPYLNASNEIISLKDNTNTTLFQFTPIKVSGNSREYLITLVQSRYGAKGTFKINTTGSGTWKAPTVQPTKTNWRYGDGYSTNTPQSVAVTMSGTVGAAQVGISATLNQFSQLVPRQGNVSIKLPDLVFQADNLQFTSQGDATLTGTLAIGPSGSGEVFAANLQLKSGSIEGTLDNTKRGYNVRLKYDGTSLTAEIKSAKDQSKNLAVIDVADGGKQVIKYADGSTEELSFAAVGGTP